MKPSPSSRRAAAAFLALALVPGCSIVKTRGPASGWRADRDPRCVVNRNPAIFDTVLAGVVGGTTALVASQTVHGSTYNVRNDAKDSLPIVAVGTALFAGSAIYGFVRTSQCASAQELWAARRPLSQPGQMNPSGDPRLSRDPRDPSFDANALAAEMRKEAQEKIDAERKAKAEKQAEAARAAAEAEHAEQERIATEVQSESTDAHLKQAPTPAPLKQKDVVRAPPGYRSTEGYQKTRWGMSRAEVEAVYPKAQRMALDGHDAVALEGDVAGKKAGTFFVFTQDRLASVAIVFADRPKNNAAALRDFDTLQRALVVKYGPPTKDQTLRDDGGVLGAVGIDLGTAISLGHAKKVSTWEPPETLVLLTAEQDDLGIGLRIVYIGKALAEEFRSESDRANAEGL